MVGWHQLLSGQQKHQLPSGQQDQSPLEQVLLSLLSSMVGQSTAVGAHQMPSGQEQVPEVGAGLTS